LTGLFEISKYSHHISGLKVEDLDIWCGKGGGKDWNNLYMIHTLADFVIMRPKWTYRQDFGVEASLPVPNGPSAPKLSFT